jgi:hypothetical protein
MDSLHRTLASLPQIAVRVLQPGIGKTALLAAIGAAPPPRPPKAKQGPGRRRYEAQPGWLETMHTIAADKRKNRRLRWEHVAARYGISFYTLEHWIARYRELFPGQI